MSHMVIYRGSDGKPGYHQVDDIHDAVSFVEEMRNNEGVDHARIFRLEEVNFEFKPYYRVEIGEGTGAAAVAAAPDEDSSDDADSVVSISSADDSDDDDSDDSGDGDSSNGNGADDEMSDDDGDDSEATTGARRGLFGR